MAYVPLPKSTKRIRFTSIDGVGCNGLCSLTISSVATKCQVNPKCKRTMSRAPQKCAKTCLFEVWSANQNPRKIYTDQSSSRTSR